MAEKIIRVAQILGRVAEGGVESMILNLYKKMDHDKIVFDFFVENLDSKLINVESIQRYGGNIILIPRTRKLLLNDKELVSKFKEGNYDIVHSNKTTLNFIYLRAAKKAGIKIRIAHAHSTSNKKEKLRNFIKFCLKVFSKKYATNLIACSEEVSKWIYGHKTGAEGKVHIVNNAVDIDKFSFKDDLRTDLRRELNVVDKYVIGHVGRFVTQKNHLFLVEIFEEVHRVKSDAVLLLLGEGPLVDQVKKKVEEYGLSDWVIFAGSHEGIYKYYNAMDCFVLPSLYEGLPVVGVEAQINGLQCFFSNTITSEILISRYSKMMELDDLNSWVSSLLNCEPSIRYISHEFKYGKFDINNESLKLLKFYESTIAEVQR